MIEALSEVVAALNARAHSTSRGRQAVLFVVPVDSESAARAGAELPRVE